MAARRYYTHQMQRAKTPAEIVITTDRVETTEAVGLAIGQRLRGGEVIELASDLGGGKTALVRGIARGAGSQDQVASPTFTVSKEYGAGELRLHHFDFYRLPEAGIMAQELAELLEDSANVVIIEWSDVVRSVLPAKRIRITIERLKQGEDYRQLTVQAPPEYGYITNDLHRD